MPFKNKKDMTAQSFLLEYNDDYFKFIDERVK